MTKKIILFFATVALAVASASNSYRVTLFQPSMLGSTELKAGDYKVEVHDNKAVITRGKQSVEANVKSESGTEKFNATSVRYGKADGKYQIQEIRLGGTTTKLTFEN